MRSTHSYFSIENLGDEVLMEYVFLVDRSGMEEKLNNKKTRTER